jgi:hypothetical protein
VYVSLGQVSSPFYADPAALQNVVATAGAQAAQKGQSPVAQGAAGVAILAQAVAAVAQAVAAGVPTATGLPTDPAALANAAAAKAASTAQGGKPPVDQVTESAVIVAQALLQVIQAIPGVQGLPANPEGDLRTATFQAEQKLGLDRAASVGLQALANDIAAVAQAVQAAGFVLPQASSAQAQSAAPVSVAPVVGGSGTSTGLWIGLAVAGAAVVGGALFFVLRRRRK